MGQTQADHQVCLPKIHGGKISFLMFVNLATDAALLVLTLVTDDEGPKKPTPSWHGQGHGFHFGLHQYRNISSVVGISVPTKRRRHQESNLLTHLRRCRSRYPSFWKRGRYGRQLHWPLCSEARRSRG